MQKYELFRKQIALFMRFKVAEDLFKVSFIAIIFYEILSHLFTIVTQSLMIL